MRITLRWKITAILVLFGLVPAAIVGWFAYYANDDYKNKQKLTRPEDGRIDQFPRRVGNAGKPHEGRSNRRSPEHRRCLRPSGR